jgi:antitoxin YefM
MQTVFHLNANELNVHFLDALKLLFGEDDITITVEASSNGHSDDDNEMDETGFLMQNPANRARLLEAIKNADAGNLITVDVAKILAGGHPTEAIIHPELVPA